MILSNDERFINKQKITNARKTVNNAQKKNPRNRLEIDSPAPTKNEREKKKKE